MDIFPDLNQDLALWYVIPDNEPIENDNDMNESRFKDKLGNSALGLICICICLFSDWLLAKTWGSFSPEIVNIYQCVILNLYSTVQ